MAIDNVARAMAASALAGGGGGGGDNSGGIFVVEMTEYDTNKWVTDKTFDEIIEAKNAGKNIYLREMTTFAGDLMKYDEDANNFFIGSLTATMVDNSAISLINFLIAIGTDPDQGYDTTLYVEKTAIDNDLSATSVTYDSTAVS